jgi:hypothetical protein
MLHCAHSLKYRSGYVAERVKFRVRQQFSSRREADWLTSRSKRLCRVKMTFGNESDALPERERLRITSGKSSAHVIVAPHLSAGRKPSIERIAPVLSRIVLLADSWQVFYPNFLRLP